MNQKTATYVVVTPVRNEEEHLPLTIASMRAQTIPPTAWIIVDDGSGDRTGEIARQAAHECPWIAVVNRGDRGFRQAGGGVVEAFKDGYALVERLPWKYLVKLDGDLSFECCYFQKCFETMSREPTLGICGGTVCRESSQGLEPEAKGDPAFHVRGATKIYRRDCWEALGGLVSAPGWDTLDEVKANMLGWKTRTLPNVKAIHHRPTGGAYGSWNDRVKAGLANYISGYHPFFMLLKAVNRMLERPFVIGGIALFYGYANGYWKMIPQVNDPALIQYLRREQWKRMLGQPSLWG